MKVKRPPLRTALLISCVLALLGLALMVWSQVDPRPIPIVVAMSTGQVVGTLSFALFGWVVLSDLRRKGTPFIPPDEPPHSLRSMGLSNPPSVPSMPAVKVPHIPPPPTDERE